MRQVNIFTQNLISTEKLNLQLTKSNSHNFNCQIQINLLIKNILGNG